MYGSVVLCGVRRWQSPMAFSFVHIDARSKCRLDLSQGNENEKTRVGKFFTFVDSE